MSPSTASPRRPYAARVPDEVRREQLLDAAIGIIVEEGYAAVSIDAVAKRAGVTRPVVYRIFDGLGDLLGTLLDRQQERALAQLPAAVPDDVDLLSPDLDPVEVAVQMVRRMLEMLRADPVLWHPILLAPLETPEAVRVRVEADRATVRAQLEQLIDLALRGQGGPPLDAEVAAHAVLAVAEHFGRLTLLEPDRFDTDRLTDMVRLVLSSLTGPLRA